MISYTQLTGFSLSCFSRHIDITDVILQRSKKKKNRFKPEDRKIHL